MNPNYSKQSWTSKNQQNLKLIHNFNLLLRKKWWEIDGEAENKIKDGETENKITTIPENKIRIQTKQSNEWWEADE